MNYYCIGNGQFIVQLFLYRDCAGVPLNGSAEIGIFNASNQLVTTVNAPKIYEINVPPLTTNPCLSPPSWVCVHEALYETTITLASSAGGYTLAAQQCCRNNSIDNITNPGNQGATYVAKIPDPAATGCNDAPIFFKFPPIAICNQDTFKYDHHATDLDGDSIVYYLCDAKDAPFPVPSPPGAPPYASVPYASPYSATYPMPASPALFIDPVTGQMLAYPNGQGTFVVAVCMDEYRNGQKIGEYRREIEFNVVSCSVAVNAQIGGTYGIGTPIYACTSYTVQFQNMSTGAPYFWWNFGTGNPGDTSIVTSPSFTYADTGTYTVTLIANKGYVCADTTYATVYVYPGTNANFTWGAPVCQGLPLQFTNQSTVQYGSITAYAWTFPTGSPGTSSQQNPSVTFATAGLKAVQLVITTSLGCTDTIIKSVIVNPTPLLTVPGDIMLCVGSDTQLVATGTGVFAWTPPGSGLSCYSCPNPIATPTSNTVYTVTLTSNQGCVNSKTVEVNLSAYPVVNAGSDVVICGTGSVQLGATANDTSGIASWKWSPSSGLSNTTTPNPFANPNPGVPGSYTYCVTATNNHGCATTDCVVVKRNIVSVNAGADQSFCAGGSAQLAATTPNAPVTWSWSPGAGLSATNIPNPVATPVTTTTYTVTVTDPDNCTATDQVTIAVYPLPPVDAGLNTSVCTGFSTQLLATGATSYVWDANPTILSGGNTASPTVQPVVTTMYYVTGTDANGCQKRDSVTVFVMSEPLVIMTPDTHMCQGVPMQLASFGPAGSTYLWSPSTFLTNPNISNPVATPPFTMTYSLRVTDPSGCYKDTSVTITWRPSPNVIASADVGICIGQNTNISASGAGVGGTYSWSPGNLSGTPLNVSPSGTTTYTVVGTDTWGCKDNDQVVVTVNPLPVVTAEPDKAICTGASTTLTVSGNAASYSWQPGGQSGTPITVSPSSTTTYTVTGVSSAGCTSTDVVVVTVNPLPIVTASTATPDICIGGSATLNAGGANTYTWMPGSMTGGSVLVSPSTTTTYTVTGTDANGCQNTAAVAVTVHQLPLVAATSATPDICLGASTTLTATGATSYSWMPGGMTGTPVNVTPANTTTYTVTGTDSWGCQNSGTVTITVHPAPPVNAGADASICVGSSTTLTASGAGAGGSYSWQPGASPGVSITVSPASTTTYTVTGTDQWGCSASDQVTVTVNSAPTVTASTATPDICAGANTTLVGGGAVSYLWQPGSIPGASPTVNPISTTTYTVTGTDANNCTATATVTITVHNLPAIVAGADQDVCVNDTATLTVSGAGAGGNYTWQPGSLTGSSITVAPPATQTYTVTGTDSWGCSNSDQVTVNVHQPPTVNAGPDKQICDGGSTTLTASGAQTYLWQPGGQTTATITVSALTVGSHSFTVTGTDQWGCSASDQADVTVNPLPVITAGSDVDICFGDNTSLSATGGVSYLWQPGGSTTNPTVVAPTSTTAYTVTGTDASGCSSTDTVTVNVLPLPNVDAGVDQAICIGESAQLNATGAASYSWTGGPMSDPNVPDPVVTPTVTTTYQLTGVGANGCTNTASVEVEVNPLPPIAANPPFYVYEGECVQLTASGGVSYQWSPPTWLDDPLSDHPTACPEDTIMYYLTGTDQNGCSNMDSTIIYVVGVPVAHVPTAFTPNGDGLNDYFRIEVYENFNLTILSIYSRWGDLIFQTNDITIGWDGTAFGKEQPIGSYVYMVSGLDEKGAAVRRQGNVTLIR
jgi:gliding motility-associated-like protein